MVKGKIGRYIFFPGLILALALFVFGLWIFWGLPSLDHLEGNLSAPSIRITDRNGKILYELIDPEQGINAPVSLDSIPEHLKLATIATEDRNFYRHPGVDVTGILRAFWINFQGGETLAGGSTITQQVARNLLLSEDERFQRTLKRKLRESWLAWLLTKNYSRDEILALYLNQMYYGGMAYGVEAAAQTYFGRPVSELTLAESALLAGIPQGPAIYNPLVDPVAAKNRQKIVLELMLNLGFITKEEHNVVARQSLEFSPSPYPIQAPHFVMWVSHQIDLLLPRPERPIDVPLVVRTTLDLDLQYLAEKAIVKHLEALAEENSATSSNSRAFSQNSFGGHNVNNAALVAIDPKTGAVLAMVGSPDYFNSSIAGAINMAISSRQPGSALKPLIYASAFSANQPNPISPATMILDVETAFVTSDNKAYIPANFDNQEHGPVSARQALASSLNIPAVIVLDQIGIESLFEISDKLGITTFGSPQSYDLSLALGGGEVTLLELSAAYGTFANLGHRVNPFSILEISTLSGDPLYQQPASAPKQVLDERVAWLISDILSDNEARSIGFGRNTVLNIDRPAAVKTGTTTNFHDNWTLGYTPDLVTGVWVGNASYEPMRSVTGLSGAGPIWHQFMREALVGTPKHWYKPPNGLTQVKICALSGLLPTNECPYTRTEWFLEGAEPVTQDNVFHRVWIDTKTGYLATGSTPAEDSKAVTVLDLPPQAYSWARENGVPLLVDFNNPVLSEQQNQVSGSYGIKILSPANRSTFLIDDSISLEPQKIHIEIASEFNLGEISLWLDGSLLTTLSGPPFETWLQLEIGEHSIWAESSGSSIPPVRSPTIHFTVITEP